MKVTAEKIGNSQKERILIDNEVFLKSVAVGKWNYITVIKSDDLTMDYIGKSATIASAEKWQPFSMEHSIEIAFATYLAPAEKIERFKQKYPKCKKVNRRRQGFKVACLVAPMEYKREVYKVERAA